MYSTKDLNSMDILVSSKNYEDQASFTILVDPIKVKKCGEDEPIGFVKEAKNKEDDQEDDDSSLISVKKGPLVTTESESYMAECPACHEHQMTEV